MRLRQLVKLHLNRQFQQREAHHLFYLNRLLNFYHIFELSVAVFVYVVVCVVVCAVVLSASWCAPASRCLSALWCSPVYHVMQYYSPDLLCYIYFCLFEMFSFQNKLQTIVHKLRISFIHCTEHKKTILQCCLDAVACPMIQATRRARAAVFHLGSCRHKNTTANRCSPQT